jgi:hypothetical protein
MLAAEPTFSLRNFLRRCRSDLAELRASVRGA